MDSFIKFSEAMERIEELKAAGDYKFIRVEMADRVSGPMWRVTGTNEEPRYLGFVGYFEAHHNCRCATEEKQNG